MLKKDIIPSSQKIVFYQDTEVQILDTETGEPFYGTLHELFIKYSDKVEWFKEDNSYGTLANPPFKITDWTGWTQIESIRKIMHHSWNKLVVGHHSLVITDYSIIPIWVHDQPYYGFHGEVRFKYWLDSFNNVYHAHTNRMSDIWYGRALRLDEEDISSKIFAPEEFHILYSEKNMYGYEINTKSGWCNVSNILMPASNKIEQVGYK